MMNCLSKRRRLWKRKIKVGALDYLILGKEGEINICLNYTKKSALITLSFVE
jgi:hypothetical protein